MAVKVTLVHAQILPEGNAAILTLGVTFGVTDIVRLFPFAVETV